MQIHANTAMPARSDTSLGDRGSALYVLGISLVVACGGLLFGYDFVVIGGAKPFFERYFALDDPMLSGWANSCALIGCLAGVIVAGGLSARLGRRRLLMASALLFAVTSVGNALAPTFVLFVTWRMMGGVAIGLASNLSPLYIAEIAPPHLRGRLVSINQLTIVLGILLAQFVNWFIVRDMPAGVSNEWIASSWFGRLGWRWMFGLTAVPSVFFFAGMLFVPESPRWLATKGRMDAARAILSRISGTARAEVALGEIRSAIAGEPEKVSFRALLDPRMRKVVVLGVTLAVFQQWCGINVIFNYAEDIFSAAGYDISSVLKNIAWTGSVNLVFTFVALGFVDKRGRRPLMLAGAGGLALIYAIMGGCFYAEIKGAVMLLLVLAAIACYAMSLAPVTWVVISEIFPTRIRGAAVAVAVAALWAACFVLTYTFPLFNKAFGAAGTFWLYSIICLSGLLFIAFRQPETKGRSLEELERELIKHEK